MDKWTKFLYLLSDKITALYSNRKLFKVIAGTLVLVVAFAVFWGKLSNKSDGGEGLDTFPIETTQTSDNDSNSQSPTEQTLADEKIYVHVTGAVAHPSVVELPAGSRVFEIIDLAGGITPEGDTKYLNLAAELTDGQQIYIPTKSEIEEMEQAEGNSSQRISNGNHTNLSMNPMLSGNSTSGNSAPASSGLVNINTADSAGLQQLTGVGPSTAEKIIDYRTNYGLFEKIEDLKNVSGIGEKTFSKLKDKICVK